MKTSDKSYWDYSEYDRANFSIEQFNDILHQCLPHSLDDQEHFEENKQYSLKALQDWIAIKKRHGYVNIDIELEEFGRKIQEKIKASIDEILGRE